ncbi:MAG TPA: adenosylhomocysteinase [Methanomassiliicoccales archaeon]|nr:adenosylhomocysteinase [Methanomassiliicoccales archaeon]HRR66106.1 adenosylhomocysteinase [Methanomassiliicoccales archaeon]
MDSELLIKGSRRLGWAEAHMAVLREVGERMRQEGSLRGVRVGMALHVEAKTGMLAVTLSRAGAKVRLASCNPLSTDDSVALALREERGIEVFARKGESSEEYYENLNAVLDLRPEFVIDDGADLITMLHTSRRELLGEVKGGNEETTTGVIRLKAMAAEGQLRFPVMAVNDARMKYLFDNRYGTGQSTFDGFMNATNLLVAGKTVVVAGYGWCGRGVAMRAKGLGAIVIVTEVDPIRAIEARLDGFQVMPMIEAVRQADVVISVTGCKDVVREEHLRVMKDGCVLGNAGHFDNEVSKRALESLASRKERVREHVDRYDLMDGRRVYLVAEGRLMNLAAGQGHPVEIMDMSFSIQALALEHLVRNHAAMEAKVYPVPAEMDELVARTKLRSMGIAIDQLTPEQARYLCEWREGTR